MRTRVKICGCANWADVEAAIEAGADAVGMIFAVSPRRIAWPDFEEIARRIPPMITPVAVFADPKRAEVEAARDALPGLVVQLHGNESGAFVSELGGLVIKAIPVRAGDTSDRLARRCEAFPSADVLFDVAREDRSIHADPFAWGHAAPIARSRPVVIAGGLTPQNVAECVRTVRPFAVDVRTGVEDGHGRTDPLAAAAFVEAVHEADET